MVENNNPNANIDVLITTQGNMGGGLSEGNEDMILTCNGVGINSCKIQCSFGSETLSNSATCERSDLYCNTPNLCQWICSTKSVPLAGSFYACNNNKLHCNYGTSQCNTNQANEVDVVTPSPTVPPPPTSAPTKQTEVPTKGSSSPTNLTPSPTRATISPTQYSMLTLTFPVHVSDLMNLCVSV